MKGVTKLNVLAPRSMYYEGKAFTDVTVTFPHQDGVEVLSTSSPGHGPAVGVKALQDILRVIADDQGYLHSLLDLEYHDGQ